jgi:hypothetical protein
MQANRPAQTSCEPRSLSQRSAWVDTEPQALGASLPRPAAGMVREALQGLQVMELHSAELFRRYFGEASR